MIENHMFIQKINSHVLYQLSYGGLKYVVADVPTTGHAIDLVLIQDNPKPLNLRSVDEHKLISWILNLIGIVT